MQASKSKRIRRTIELRNGIKEMYFCEIENIVLLLLSDVIQILDLSCGEVVVTIKKFSYPRSVRLSKCGSFFVGYFSDNTVSLFDTKRGF
jgi:hypothetical protein